MKNLLTLMGAGALAAVLGCGGGGGGSTAAAPAGANRLVYTEPAAGGWGFTKISGTGSFSDPLILELRGPSGAPVKGAACYLDLGSSPKVAWHALSGSAYVDALTNPNLGLGAESAPRLVKDKLAQGVLQVGVFKKTGSADPSLGVFRVALRLASDSQAPGAVVVTARNSKVLDAADATSSPTFTFGEITAE